MTIKYGDKVFVEGVFESNGGYYCTVLIKQREGMEPTRIFVDPIIVRPYAETQVPKDTDNSRGELFCGSHFDSPAIPGAGGLV